MAAAYYTSSKPVTIQQKIEQALTLFATWGKKLHGDPGVAALIKKFEERTTDTRNAMRDLGIIALCKDCEEKQGGSCCGAGIENKYNEVLLLVNLLLGAPLPQKRHKTNSCYFLGNEGCTLKARHTLCINYLCSRIEQRLSRENLICLQYTGGEEVDALFILYEQVKKVLRRYSDL